MSRRYVVLIAAVALLPGCVPVTEPVTDPDKAEPDERLVGRWKEDADIFTVIDIPAVKGNPKGLMRAAYNGATGDDPANVLWFTVSKVGTDTYANVCLGKPEVLEFAQFAKEGAYAGWQKQKQKDKGCFVFRYAVDGDTLVVDGGARTSADRLTRLGKFDTMRCVPTPPGWLAKQLANKKLRDEIYDGTNDRKFVRDKR